MLSQRWNPFHVCSVCDKIVSAYAQHAHAIIFENYSKIPNKNANFYPKKFGSAYAQSPRKCSNSKFWRKSKETKRNFVRKFTKGIEEFDLGQTKFKIISCLCTFNLRSCGLRLSLGRAPLYSLIPDCWSEESSPSFFGHHFTEIHMKGTERRAQVRPTSSVFV